MSKALVNLVYGRRWGSAARKAVALAMAERANDDGSSIFVSKTRLSAETEFGRTTVVAVVSEFVAEELLRLEGKRPGRDGGYTFVYTMSVGKVRGLPMAWGECSDPNTLDGSLAAGDDQPPASVDKPVEKTGGVFSQRALKKRRVFTSGGSSVHQLNMNRPSMNKKGGDKAIEGAIVRAGFVEKPARPRQVREVNGDELELEQLRREHGEIADGSAFAWYTPEQREQAKAVNVRRQAEIRARILERKRSDAQGGGEKGAA